MKGRPAEYGGLEGRRLERGAAMEGRRAEQGEAEAGVSGGGVAEGVEEGTDERSGERGAAMVDVAAGDQSGQVGVAVGIS